MSSKIFCLSLVALLYMVGASSASTLDSLKALEEQVVRLRGVVSRLQDQASALRNDNNRLRNLQDTGKAQITAKAFHAETSRMSAYVPGQRLDIDVEVNDFGGVFTDASDQFKCPDNGVYVMTVLGRVQQTATAGLAVQLMDVVDRYFHMEGLEKRAAITDSYIQQCVTGRDMWLERTDDNTGPSTAVAIGASFVGYKIFD